MTYANPNTDTSTLDGVRYVLTVKNQFNRLYTSGSLADGTEVICLRKNESGYYLPCAAFIVGVKQSGRITVDLYTDRIERVTVSPKAILWSTPPRCSRCYAPIVGQGNIGGRCHNTNACRRRADERNLAIANQQSADLNHGE